MSSFRKWALGYGVILSLTLLTAQWCSHTVTVMAEQAPIPRAHTIIIDPGHGGVDGGATSCTGVLESKFNLDIGLRLNDLLHFLGYDTRMIRREDISVYTEGNTIAQKKLSDLKHRVQTVNVTENGILLSIHQNNFPESRYSGAQVFYPGTPGSRELAQSLQASFGKHLGSSRQEKKSAGVYLLEHIRRTGVLIECGFLSNPREEALLRSDAYQQKLCTVIACGLSSFLSNT